MTCWRRSGLFDADHRQRVSPESPCVRWGAGSQWVQQRGAQQPSSLSCNSSAVERTYSVVIATYRRPELVLECIKSVLAQTHPALEILIVDDGSKDGTSALIRSNYPTVQVIEQENRGRSIAANRGAAAACGDYVCLLDDDDLWHPEKLSEVDSYLNDNPGCLAVNHPVWFFTPSNHTSSGAYGFSIDFAANSLQECLDAIADAHGRWRVEDGRSLGVDRLEVYERAPSIRRAAATQDERIQSTSKPRSS